MKKHILTVTLNPAIDETLLSDGSILTSAGGKGVNVARTLTCLGVETISSGIYSGKTGKKLLKLINQEGLKFSFTKGSGETRKNITYLNYKKNKTKRKINLGPKLTKVDIERFIKRFRCLLKNTKIVIFSGRNANNASSDLYARLIEEARLKDIPTFLDTSGLSLKQGVLAKPTFIKPNIDEAEKLLQQKLKSNRQIRSAINKLHSLGIEYVLITLGKNGVVGSNKKECWHVIAPKIALVSDVGCGDAFIGGFIFSFLSKYSFVQSLKMATATGTANCLTEIPGKIHKKELFNVIRNIRCRKL